MAERKNSEARIKANNRYNEKAYDRINIAVPKGRKDLIKAHAESHGESVNGFVNRAIDETMEREKSDQSRTYVFTKTTGANSLMRLSAGGTTDENI